MSTGFGDAERAGIRIDDGVAVFAQDPICLCAAAGAKPSGPRVVIGVDRLVNRLCMSRQLGADHLIDASRLDPGADFLRQIGGPGVAVAIEALGTQATFAAALRVLGPGCTLSSLGVYPMYANCFTIPLSLFASGLGDHNRHHAVPRWQEAHAPADVSQLPAAVLIWTPW